MTDTATMEPAAHDESLVIATTATIAVRRDPREILAEAHTAAAALKEVLDSKKDPVMMNGERYIENDDWQTVGRFYGITAKIEAVTFQTYQIPGREPIYGFDAVAVALGPDGRIISRAEASCLSDEEKWGARPKYAWVYAKTATKGKDGALEPDELWPADYDPQSSEIVWVPNPKKPGKSMPLKARVLVGTEAVPLFQLKSMSQTRASSKVYRQVLAFVPVMAGYKPTPAEELEGYGAERVTTKAGTTADVKTGEIVEEDGAPHPAGRRTKGGHPPRTRNGAPLHPDDPDDPLPVTTPARTDTESVISDAQRKRLYAIWKEAGWRDEEVKDLLLRDYNIDSTTHIPRSQYDEIVNLIRMGKA